MIALLSCSSFKTEPVYVDQRVSQKITEMKSSLSDLRNQKAHLFTPDFYEEANEILNDSKERAREGDKYIEMAEEFNEFETIKEKMKKRIVMTKTHLKGVLEARNEAVRAGARDTKLFTHADEGFKELGIMIQAADINRVIEYRSELEKLYQKAEIGVIKNRKLKNVRENLRLVEELDGDDHYPKLFDKVVKDLENAKRVIASHKDNMFKIDSAVYKAENNSERLLALSKTAHWLNNISPSNAALELEKNFKNVFKDFYVSHRPEFYSAKVNFRKLKEETSYVPSMRAEITRLAQSNDILDNRVTEILKREKKVKKALTENKRLEKKITEFKREVGSSNADIFRKGDAILVRLKGVKFDFNKSKIPSKSKPIIDEVVEFIDKFEKPKVVVEGHSDAIGNPSYNKVLSKKRAENVMDYILKKTSQPLSTMRTIGHGFNKPIVDNRTVSNRETNRRIDILIYPNS